MNKKNKKKRWPWIIAIIAVVVIAIFVLRPSNQAIGTLGIRSATVSKDSISVTVVGSGNLEYDDTLDIEVPSGITIDKVIVESGDTVSEGDTIATINSVSLKTKIASVRDEISSLDRQINSIKEDTEPEEVKTRVSGRVKKIFVEKGDSVLDVISQNGALMLISIDEKMAVDFESSANLSVGDKVKVILENENAKEGTVKKASGGHYTVTLTDNGPKLDEAVTIKNTDGNVLSTGVLYIHQPVKIVATSGTVKTIHVTENEKVGNSRKLMTLKNLPSSVNYEKLLADRDDLNDRLDMLLSYSKTNSILADSNGVIMDVNIEDGKDTSIAAPTAMTSGDSASSSQATASGNTVKNNVVAFTVSSNDNLVLAIEIDELDILSIEKDMEAEITFDAITNKTFNAKITKIADSANASGGVAKYTVKLLVPRDGSMKAGMNATATILVEQRESILTIPIVALHELGDRVFVYTQEDSKTGELSGGVDVKTGISDGENVEILSGLTEGSNVYYTVNENQYAEYFMRNREMQNNFQSQMNLDQ